MVNVHVRDKWFLKLTLNDWRLILLYSWIQGLTFLQHFKAALQSLIYLCSVALVHGTLPCCLLETRYPYLWYGSFHQFDTPAPIILCTASSIISDSSICFQAWSCSTFYWLTSDSSINPLLYVLTFRQWGLQFASLQLKPFCFKRMVSEGLSPILCPELSLLLGTTASLMTDGSVMVIMCTLDSSPPIIRWAALYWTIGSDKNPI